MFDSKKFKIEKLQLVCLQVLDCFLNFNIGKINQYLLLSQP